MNDFIIKIKKFSQILNWFIIRILLSLIGLFATRKAVGIQWFFDNFKLDIIAYSFFLFGFFIIKMQYERTTYIKNTKICFYYMFIMAMSITLMVMIWEFSRTFIIFCLIFTILILMALFFFFDSQNKNQRIFFSSIILGFSLLFGGLINSIVLNGYFFMLVTSITIFVYLRNSIAQFHDYIPTQLNRNKIMLLFRIGIIFKLTVLIAFPLSILIWIPLLYSSIFLIISWKKISTTEDLLELNKSFKKNINRAIIGQIGIVFVLGI